MQEKNRVHGFFSWAKQNFFLPPYWTKLKWVTLDRNIFKAGPIQHNAEMAARYSKTTLNDAKKISSKCSSAWHVSFM